MEATKTASGLSTRDYVANYLVETKALCDKIDQTKITAFVDALFDCWKRGNTVFLFGNGGSASTAQHMANDLFKCTLIDGKPRMKVLCLNDNMPLLSALTNDEGWARVYTEQLRTWFRAGDVAIGISVHGGKGADKAGPWSQNLVGALTYAKEQGGKALGLVGFDGGAMRTLCDVAVIVPADSTPHTEGFHLVLEHMITGALRERMERDGA